MGSFIVPPSQKAAKKAAKKAEKLANKERQESLEDKQRLTAVGERALATRASGRGRNLLRFTETLGGTG